MFGPQWAWARHVTGTAEGIAQAAHSGPFQAIQGKETPPTLPEETSSLCIFVLAFFQDAVVGIASKVWVHTLCRVWESPGGATDKAFVAPARFFSEVADQKTNV